jgi:hypothetical protein
MEPLLEQATEVISQVKEAETYMAQTQAKCTRLVSDDIIVQVLNEPHVNVGGLLEEGQNENKGYFGKKGMHEESDSWKEDKHAHMHGITNDLRVRVFVIHCNG